MNLAEPESTPGEWESRSLCPDESCIGVLGADGRCAVCGRTGDPLLAVADPAEEPVPEPALSDDLVALTLAADGGGSSDDLGERELCPDDGCIGVLDAQGSCKVCGAARPGTNADPGSDSATVSNN